jgi:LPXTG-site transpeptidase (sortase) family protein
MGQQKIGLKSGKIFGGGGEKREVNIAIRMRFLPILAKLLSVTGLLMILVAVGGIVGIYIPLGVAEVRYVFMRSDLGKFVRITEKKIAVTKTPEIVTKALELKPSWDVPDYEYSIFIPKIEAVSRVVANVNAGNAKEYSAALKKGVAEAFGLSHPGEKGTTYLFAHSVGSRVDYARFNAVFYLLDKVVDGDTVEIVYQGKLFRYEVVGKEILAANDTRYLVPQSLSEKLILQTCYPPGTSWKRLVVLGRRIY